MASMNCKRIVAVATLAASTVVMGGTAFAGNLAPDTGKAIDTARNTVGDVHNRISGLANDPSGKAAETARNAEADGVNRIKRAFQ